MIVINKIKRKTHKKINNKMIIKIILKIIMRNKKTINMIILYKIKKLRIKHNIKTIKIKGVELAKQAGVCFRDYFWKLLRELKKGSTDYENLLPMTMCK